MKVLIICNDFPPINSIGAERPYSWYKYFHKHNIDVTVVTKNWKTGIVNPNDVVGNISNETKVENDAHGKIVRTPHNGILPEKMILKYGIDRFAFVRRIFTFVYKLLSFHILYYDQHKHLYLTAKKMMQHESFDAIITTGEPNVLFRYGYLLKRKFPNIMWIADFRDGWFFDHVSSLNKSILNKVIRKHEYLLEKKYLSIVDIISSVDPILCGRMEQLHSKKTLCIYNGFWEYYSKENDSLTSNKLVLTHTGTLTPGQRVEFLLEAVEELLHEKRISTNDIEIRFIGIEYFTEQTNRIRRSSESFSAAVVTTPRIPKNEAIQHNLDADFLLSFTEEKNKAIYAKTYDYIACKKEILVLPDDESILGELVKEHQLGHVFQNKSELKNFIVQQVEEKKKGNLQSNATKNYDNLSFFSRANQTKVFAEAIKKLIDRA